MIIIERNINKIHMCEERTKLRKLIEINVIYYN